MNASGFAAAVVDALHPSKGTPAPPLRVVSTKDLAIRLARAVLREDSNMILTQSEAKTMAREFLSALGLER